MEINNENSMNNLSRKRNIEDEEVLNGNSCI